MAYFVRLSGIVLSSLLYECANAERDIEGFLLGTLSFKTTLTNDDSSEHAFEKREDFIKKPYDSNGNVVKHLFTSQQKDVSSVVGYFKFRRQTDVSLSVRDRLWMKSYASNIPHGCIAIISSNNFSDPSTQTFEFAFWDMKNSENKLPINIANMKESTLGYKSFISNAPHTNQFLPSTKNISAEIIVKQYEDMYQTSIHSLKEYTDKIIKKEAKLLALKKEILELEAKNKK
ncbi:uncharacterized protein BX663DRAFT_58460 [Cokeromyces recurvatus]|uniref:uncharacterized protein n=1 Tax=Cokeromyces recurvatus TaxID=90255 RepID=UPI00222129AF|nr:uncharacterized protein BX663DRAFT_58460 [Cokeromyces recurvatus]KAI7903026.1 hypothetical protein BX663DRAFT_58460 [Cokeromyces recurvatus]